jgi:hypothetical protein
MILNDVFICDVCKGDQGEFNTDTGNHVACEEIAALRVQLDRRKPYKAVSVYDYGSAGISIVEAALKKALAENEALRAQLAASEAEIKRIAETCNCNCSDTWRVDCKNCGKPKYAAALASSTLEGKDG